MVGPASNGLPNLKMGSKDCSQFLPNVLQNFKNCISPVIRAHRGEENRGLEKHSTYDLEDEIESLWLRVSNLYSPPLLIM